MMVVVPRGGPDRLALHDGLPWVARTRIQAKLPAHMCYPPSLFSSPPTRGRVLQAVEGVRARRGIRDQFDRTCDVLLATHIPQKKTAYATPQRLFYAPLLSPA